MTKNKLIPEELDILIREYLTDGVITAKERMVLLNKADSLGLNLDEINLYIDAQVQKIELQRRKDAKNRKGQFCPHCGASIPQLTDKCPLCGQYISVDASDKLAETLNKLENALVDFESGKEPDRNRANVERYTRQATIYGASSPMVKDYIDKVNARLAVAEKKIKKDSRRRMVKSFITKNKWILGFVWLMALLLFIIGLLFLLVDSDPCREDVLMPKVEAAIAEDNFHKAYSEVENARSKSNVLGNKDTKVCNNAEQFVDAAVTKKINEEISAGQVNEAEKLIETYKSRISTYEVNRKLADYYLNTGDYDKYFNKDIGTMESQLHAVVGKMIEKGETKRARSLIIAKYPYGYSTTSDYGRECADKIKQSLLGKLDE